MAVTIIGASDNSSTQTLSFPEHNLPHPSSVEAEKPIWSPEKLTELLQHTHPMVRAFAVRRIAASGDTDAINKLLAQIDDESPAVARSAIDALSEIKSTDAIAPLSACFSKSGGELAADAAVALGRIAPQALVALVKARGRLDDYAYAITTMQLARTEDNDARAYLTKAMSRAGVLSPGRRIALYTAALMSGDASLCKRVLATAISESKAPEDPKAPPSAARLAIGAAAGLPGSMAPKSAGATLLQSITPQDEDKIDDEVQQAFVTALRAKKPGEAIRTLAPLTVHGVSDYASAELQSAGRRCRILLDSLISQTAAMAQLDAESCAIFAAAALDAASIVHASQNNPGESPALIALARVLEVDAMVVLEEETESLAKRFEKKSPREIRKLTSILSANPIEEEMVIDKLILALALAGHGSAVLDAAAEAKTDQLGRSSLRVFTKSLALGETVALEALERQPLEPHVAVLALVLAADIATERLSLAIGRRFLEFRQIDRMRFANAIIKMGDVRLTELAKARAYRDEPEEAAWVLLSLLGGAALEGELAETDKRIQSKSRADSDFRIILPLTCMACDETLTYRFFSVFVDPQALDQHGDPAYVGDTRCKACGQEDQLKPTDIAVKIMTEQMVSFMIEAEKGDSPSAPPKVVPRRTRYNGVEMSVAAAAREADKDVASSPDSIRAHLRRARIRLLLRRNGALEDSQKAVEIDPKSAEAKYVLAGALAQKGQLDEAVLQLIETRDLLLLEEEPRLYEETRDVLLSETDGSLLQLERIGANLPEELDLSKARAEEEAYEKELAKRRAGITPVSEADSSATQPAKRNEACPCGSGKKFKKCCGQA